MSKLISNQKVLREAMIFIEDHINRFYEEDIKEVEELYMSLNIDNAEEVTDKVLRLLGKRTKQEIKENRQDNDIFKNSMNLLTIFCIFVSIFAFW